MNFMNTRNSCGKAGKWQQLVFYDKSLYVYKFQLLPTRFIRTNSRDNWFCQGEPWKLY